MRRETRPTDSPGNNDAAAGRPSDEDVAVTTHETKVMTLDTDSEADLANEAMRLGRAGAAAYQRRRYATAVGLCTVARDLFAKLAARAPSPEGHVELLLASANCTLNLASITDDMGRHEEALDHCGDAKGIFSLDACREVDRTGVARCDLALATINSRLNRPQQALALYQQAREVFAREQQLELVALCDSNMGGIFDEEFNDSESALALYQGARDIYQLLDNEEGVRRADFDIAIVQRNKQRRSVQPDKMPSAFMFTAKELGGIPVVVTMADEVSQGEWEKIKKSDTEQMPAGDRALVLLASSDPTNPVNCDKVIEHGGELLHELAGDPRLRWRLALDLAKAYRTRASLFYYHLKSPLFATSLKMENLTVLTFADSLPQKQRAAFLRFLNERQFGLREYLEAYLDNEEDLDTAENENPATTMIFSGFFNFKQKRYKNLEIALKYADEAVSVLDNLRSEQASDHTKLSLMADKQEPYAFGVDVCIELEEFLMALERIEKARSRVFLDALGTTPVLPPAALAPDLVERERLLLSALRDQADTEPAIGPSAPAAADRAAIPSREVAAGRLKSLRESHILRRAEAAHELRRLYDQIATFAPEYVALRRGTCLDIEGIRRLVAAQPPGTVVVEYNIGSASSQLTLGSSEKLESHLLHGVRPLAFVWPCAAERPQVVSLPLPMEELRALVEQATYVPGRRAAERSLEVLGEVLIEPLRELVADHNRLVIIPHNQLHAVPFHALKLGRKQVIDDFIVSYAPSLSILRYCQMRPAAPDGAAVFAGGDGTDQASEEFFKEAGSIARALGVESEVGPRLTRSRFFDSIHAKRWVHIACHGEFNRHEPMNSALHLTSDGPVTAADFFRCRVAADLITLSACDAGRSVVLAGDELLGITRGLLYAGAKSILASLWALEADWSPEIMGRIYARLQEGSDKASAVRDAQLWARSQRPEPFYWSPQVLIGDHS